jgi:membrane protease YdiL (CAAX protease family)
VRKFYLFLRVLTFLCVSAVLLALTSPLAGRLPDPESTLVTGAATALSTLLLTWLFVRWEKMRLRDVGAMADRRSIHRLLAGFLAGLLLIASWAGLSVVLGVTRWVRTDRAAIAIALSLVVYLLLACREQLAFHGYPLFRLRERFGLWPAQLFIALVFALEHRLGGMSWSDAFLGAGIGSLLFGMAALASRGLAVPVGIHAAWNTGHWALGLKGSPGLWTAAAVPGADARSGMLLYDLVMLAATAAFWLVYRRGERQKEAVNATLD